jgi:hypothetical protein
MAVLVVGKEKSFSDLRARLLPGRRSAAALARAKAALVAANPHANLEALVPGTVLTVPDVPDIPDRGELSLDGGVRDDLASVADELMSGLAAMRGDAEALTRQERVDFKRTIGAFDDDLVRRAAAGDQDLAAALDAARAAVEQRQSESDARLELIAVAADEWTAEIKALLELAG